MRLGKDIGPDDIPTEVWKGLDDREIECFTLLFNNILRTKITPNEWRVRDLVTTYQVKGDIQSYTKNRVHQWDNKWNLLEGVIKLSLRV